MLSFDVTLIKQGCKTLANKLKCIDMCMIGLSLALVCQVFLVSQSAETNKSKTNMGPTLMI